MSETTKMTLLLVEDESVIAITEKVQLEKYDYKVLVVSTGEKAIEAVKTSSEIDLVLMDINLGDGIDGTEAAEVILKDRDIPILFLSSHSEREIVEKTKKITSYGYVLKNSSITVLDASIKMAFKLFEKDNIRFNTLAGSQSILIWESGVNKLCTYFNPTWLAYTGKILEEELGNGWVAGVHPDDVERCLKTFNEAFDERREFSMEYRLRKSTGEYGWILDHGSPKYHAQEVKG